MGKSKIIKLLTWFFHAAAFKFSFAVNMFAAAFVDAGHVISRVTSSPISNF